jgi:polysaccharide chain length determinant protein (PEP-CTERM system associated)
MNLDLRYYLSIFWRRLPIFLLVAGTISGLALAAALTLPPAYVSETQLIIEQPSIPDGMAGPTLDVPPEEQLNLFETRLLTRPNMLEIARKLNVLKGQADMSADQIVDGMKSRTKIRVVSGRNKTTAMTISFEARSAQTAAAVLNEYLTMILQQDAANRTGRAGETQEFFKQEVTRLSQELDQQSAKILSFKNEHSDALPESLEYSRSQQVALQDRLAQADRDIASLRDQRDRLVQVFQATGRIDAGPAKDLRSPEEKQLEDLRGELAMALQVYSAENPRVKILKARIEQLEKVIAGKGETAAGADAAAPVDPAKAMLDLQLAEIDAHVAALEAQKQKDQDRLDSLTASIAQIPANQIALAEMQRDYDNLQNQYNQAVDRLSTASAGERIALSSRGEKVSVVDQPSIPTEASKPNREQIAALGIVAGIAAGFGMIALLEALNGTARRPMDLVNRLGVAPVATIPYLRTRREKLFRQGSQIAMVLLVLLAIPAALMALNYYYMPLDLLADRVMSKFGLRG